jgi:hypothetical protein
VLAEADFVGSTSGMIRYVAMATDKSGHDHRVLDERQRGGGI